MTDPSGGIDTLNSGFESSPELDQFRTAVRGHLGKAIPVRQIRGLIEKPGTRFDPQIWTALAHGLGVQGLLIPEDLDGLGASWIELGAVFEETGRALLPGPLLTSAAMATPALLAAPACELRSQWLGRLAAGAAVGAFAVATTDPEPTVRAAQGPGGWVLDGDAGAVVDVDRADVMVVGAADDRGQVATYLIDPAHARLEQTQCFDLTHRMDQVRLDGTAAQLLDTSTAPLDAGRTSGGLALACEQVGAARMALEITLAHVASRTQFGQPIGAFQAVKHRCVEMFIEVESALLSVRAACRALAAGSADAHRLVTIARLVSAESSSFVTEEAIQLHGGIGFTWEHDCHLYLRRSTFAQLLIDPPDALRADLVAYALARKEDAWRPPGSDRS